MSKWNIIRAICGFIAIIFGFKILQAIKVDEVVSDAEIVTVAIFFPTTILLGAIGLSLNIARLIRRHEN